MEIFHQRLREGIYAKGLNISKIARLIGVTQASMHEWVSGKSIPNLTRFKQICEVLEMDANFLLGLDIKSGGVLISHP